jgi:hypothetical protein
VAVLAALTSIREVVPDRGRRGCGSILANACVVSISSMNLVTDTAVYESAMVAVRVFVTFLSAAVSVSTAAAIEENGCSTIKKITCVLVVRALIALGLVGRAASIAFTAAFRPTTLVTFVIGRVGTIGGTWKTLVPVITCTLAAAVGSGLLVVVTVTLLLALFERTVVLGFGNKFIL